MDNLNKLVQTFLAMALMFLMGCHDIIEKDITKNTITVKAPVDNFESTGYNITFWWDEVNGAGQYRLQICKPSFDSLQQFVVDTLVPADRCVITLFPGRYQWRIRAENAGSSTPFVTRNLIVDSNSDFSNQVFIVNSPGDNFVTNTNPITFRWSTYPFATSYQYQLTDTFGNEVKARMATQAFVVDTLAEGVYLWQVKAINGINGTATAYSVARRITLDLTAPMVSNQIAPANNSLDSNGLNLTWMKAADVYADSIIVASDSSFQAAVVNAYVLGDTSFQLPPLPISHTYYWRLRSRDQAGNWSVYSTAFKFTLIY